MRSFYNDERVIKTKKLIKTALSELIQEKGFDHVSITDLTQRANINRGTFYLHYQDKYDLLEKFENEVLDDINTNAENFIKSIKDIDFLGEDFSNEIKPFINKVFTYRKENYTILKVILGPKSDMRFQNKIKKALNIKINKKGWDNYFDSQNTFVSKNYFISYLVSAHIGVIRQWIDSGMNESAENMAEMISKMFFLGPFNSIKNK